MQACIHRGSKEIGGSCVEVVSREKRIVIDLGLPLDSTKDSITYLPDIPGLIHNDDSLLAIIISHPHIDHYGLLSHVRKDIPVIMGAAARRIITAAAPFMRSSFTVPAGVMDLTSEEKIKLGPFTITPYLMDHSGYDSYSLLIEADEKRLFYTGDFRSHGRKAKLTEKLMANPPRGIDVLLMEGSTLGRSDADTHYPTESDIEKQLADIFKNTSGLTLVHVSSQNIDRIVSIFRACKRSNKTLVIDLYTAVILDATGNSNIPQSSWPGVALYIPQSQRVKIKNDKLFDILKKHSLKRIYIENIKEFAVKFVLLFRTLHIPDLEKNDLQKNSIYIYSMWEGYWPTKSLSPVREWINKHSIPMERIHTSGHSSTVDLQRFAESMRPGIIVPIHTFEPKRYAELFDNVKLYSDGECWTV